ncbi:MAG: MarR family transcriptional regulator [Spirochaetales bacterium]|nr:MarR family transcriptional regulator [Spirochaetales bacterium]
MVLKELAVDGNLIDLISDNHLLLRKTVMERMADGPFADVTMAEGHLLNRIHGTRLSVSAAARVMDMSRQAVHRCALELEKRGYLILEPGENRREKALVMTEKGKAFYRDNNALKRKMEEEITRQLGPRETAFLKETLDRLEIRSKEQY